MDWNTITVEFDRICISGSSYRERISKRSDAQHFELELARVILLELTEFQDYNGDHGNTLTQKEHVCGTETHRTPLQQKYCHKAHAIINIPRVTVKYKCRVFRQHST